VDSYTAVAKLITGKAQVTEDERQIWKRTYLSLLYGGGAKTIQLQFGNSQAEARKIINTFHRNWPAVRALQDMVIETHAKRGYIKTPWGRHLHMEQYGEHKLLNKLIQGSAADLMKAALIRVDAHLRENPQLESHMVSVVHDEIQMDGPEREVPYLHNAIPNLMSEEWLGKVVPVLVDHEVSTTSWADKIAYEEWAGKVVA
jgi:DNA polymerase-1